MTSDNTRRIDHSPSPEVDTYHNTALQWFLYPAWTIDKAANLLTGCLPKRQMFQPGADNVRLDQMVLTTENHIRRALGKSLAALTSKKYFAPIEVQHKQLIQWANQQDLVLPEPQLAAYEVHRTQEQQGQYTTPCLEAIAWTRKHYWHSADFRDAPTKGEIVHALLQAFSELNHEECMMVEYMCRHPLTRD